MSELRIRSTSVLPIGSIVNVDRVGDSVGGVVTAIEDDPRAIHGVEFYIEDEGGTEMAPQSVIVVVTVP